MAKLTFKKARHGSFNKYDVFAIRVGGKDVGYISPKDKAWYWYAWGHNTLLRQSGGTWLEVEEAKADVKEYFTAMVNKLAL